MEVIFKASGQTLVAAVKGDIDHHTASALRAETDESMKNFGCLNLVMDFSEVAFMDSSGIGVVLGRYKRLVRKGGRICVSGCSSYIEKVLDMAGVFSLVEKASDVKEALSLLDGQEQISMEV